MPGRTCDGSSVEEAGSRTGQGDDAGGALRMEQSGENQATACSICRDHGLRSSLLQVDGTIRTVTIIAIIARNSDGERVRDTVEGYATDVKSRHFHANAGPARKPPPRSYRRTDARIRVAIYSGQTRRRLCFAALS